MENESGIIAPRPRAAAGGRRCRRRAVFRGNHVDLIRLRVERQRLAADLGLHRLVDLEAGRAVFLDDGQRAVALRAERLHRRGIEDRAVHARRRSAAS